MSIRDNYRRVAERIAGAARRAGREATDVRIIAVSKTFPVDAIAEGIDAGITAFGENRAQELKQKVALLGDRTEWHFVGHLQSNKVRMVMGSVVLIHSVDRYGLAEEIARRARAGTFTQDVLVEVNVAGESSKHGVEPERAVRLALDIAGLEGLRVKGLMAMSSYPEDPEDARPRYKALAGLRDELVRDLPDARELSMGMTRDYEVAVEEGASIVRVGEAIFGPRG